MQKIKREVVILKKKPALNREPVLVNFLLH